MESISKQLAFIISQDIKEKKEAGGIGYSNYAITRALDIPYQSLLNVQRGTATDLKNYQKVIDYLKIKKIVLK